MIERKEAVVGIGHHLQKGITHQRLIECQSPQHRPQRVAIAIGSLHQTGKQRLLLIVGEALACYVIGLVVDDASVGGRTA